MRAPIAAGAAGLALILAGCGRGTPTRDEAASGGDARPAPAATPAATAAVAIPVAVPPGTALPPMGPQPRYVGRWAATTSLCRDGAWIFRDRSLVTAGEVSCEFTAVTPTAGGYDIAATCRAEGPPKPYRLTLSFAESARAMFVEGGPFAGSVGLIWCGVR